VTLREIKLHVSSAILNDTYALDYLCYPTSALATWIHRSRGRRFYSCPPGYSRHRFGYPVDSRSSTVVGATEATFEIRMGLVSERVSPGGINEGSQAVHCLEYVTKSVPSRRDGVILPEAATHCSPGLKAWAVLSSRLAAKSDSPLRDKPGFSCFQALRAWLP
jgi:hypothetical protein